MKTEEGKRANKLKQGGINLTAEERSVLETIVKNGNIKWFSYAKRTYGDRRDKRAEHFYPFDRVIDKETNDYMSITEALKRIEAAINEDVINCLDEREKKIYAALFERSNIVSKFLKVEYSGIFKNKGLFRRAIRWSAMDELAQSFVNKKAKELWEKEGYPLDAPEWGALGRSPMECFRESDKFTLSEEEFDRISKVFRECINM